MRYQWCGRIDDRFPKRLNQVAGCCDNNLPLLMMNKHYSFSLRHVNFDASNVLSVISDWLFLVLFSDSSICSSCCLPTRHSVNESFLHLYSEYYFDPLTGSLAIFLTFFVAASPCASFLATTCVSIYYMFQLFKIFRLSKKQRKKQVWTFSFVL